MAFYENTIVARQDLAENELLTIKNKYKDLINDSSGKLIKIEEWGLLNLAQKIKRFNKGFFIHYKFEGQNNTIDQIKKKSNIDKEVLRYLTVKYKSLDLETEYFMKKSKF